MCPLLTTRSVSPAPSMAVASPSIQVTASAPGLAARVAQHRCAGIDTNDHPTGRRQGSSQEPGAAPKVEDLVRIDRVGQGAVVLVVVAGGIVAVVQLYELLVAVRVLIHARRLRRPPDERN